MRPASRQHEKPESGHPTLAFLLAYCGFIGLMLVLIVGILYLGTVWK